MAFRGTITRLSELVADTVTGALIRTAADGTARILIGAGVYQNGAPAISWDLKGTGLDWTEPFMQADPANNNLDIYGQVSPTGRPWIILSGTDRSVTLGTFDNTLNNDVILKLNPATKTVDIHGGVTTDASITVLNESWIAPALLNGWVTPGAIGSATQTVAYRKMADGTVNLRGVGGGGPVSTVMFTLPIGYRPALDEWFLCLCNGGAVQIAVKLTGDVYVNSYIAGGTNAVVSLAGIRFSNSG